MSLPLRVGTAGWTIPSRFSESIPSGGSHLKRYARVLNAAEINSSFHKPHQRKTYEKWAASVPADFHFAVKLPKVISHERALANCEAELARFFEEASGLGDKLHVLLIQTPPKGMFDVSIASRFIESLREHNSARIALEPRHASWFTPEANAWLASRKIARVAADPAKIEGAGEPGGDTSLIYYRWHGAPRMYYSDYDSAALADLKRRLESYREEGAEVWCIFDNTASGAALGNALAINAP